MKARPVLIVVTGAVLLGAGCTHRWEERHTAGTLLGAATGASLGALIGGAAGSWGRGAVIGAGAGALTGYLIAESTRPRWRRPVRYYDIDGARMVYYREPAPAEADRRSLELYPTPPACNNVGLILLRRGDRIRSSF